MRALAFLATALLSMSAVLHADDGPPPPGAATRPLDDFAPAVRSFLESPAETWRDAASLELSHVAGRDLRAVADRVARIPRLQTLILQDADLSDVPADLPVPSRVEHVAVWGGRLSQSAVDWLARFPAGVTLVIHAPADLSSLRLELGPYREVTIGDCKVSPSNLRQLFERYRLLKFDECRWVPDPAPQGDDRRG